MIEPIIDQNMKETVDKYINTIRLSDNQLQKKSNHSANGLFADTILVRAVDDTFLTFECKVEIINEFDLAKLWRTIEENKNKCNVIIDSRMTWLILFAILKYENDVLIYDVYRTRIITVYRYFAKLSGISIDELSISKIKHITILKLFISHFAREYEIQWKITDIIKNMNKFTNKFVETRLSDGNLRYHEQTNTNKFINNILNYMGILRTNKVDPENIEKLKSLIKKYFSKDILYNMNLDNINPWHIDGSNICELREALEQLKDNEYDLSLVCLFDE